MCPVCHARFRGDSVCSRCGADLNPLMRLQADAWRLRQAARQAIADGHPPRAHALALAAQRTQRTPAGSRLELLSRWLETGILPSSQDQARGQLFPEDPA